MKEKQAYPKVSVMISTYHQTEEADVAIQSALKQDYPNYNIVVSDDATGPGELDGLKQKYKNENVLFHSFSKNVGRVENFRKLLYDLADGEFVTMLNADDYLKDPTFISKAVRLIQSDDKIAFVFGRIELLIRNRGITFVDQYHDHLPQIVDGNQFFIEYPKGYSVPHVGNLYRRQEAIEFDFYRLNAMSQDWESFLRLAMNRKIGVLTEIVATKVQHRKNVTKTEEIDQYAENEMYIQKLFDEASRLNLFSKDKLDNWREKMLIRHHTKWLVKIYYLKRNEEIPYHNFLKNKHPEVYSKITKGYKFRAFKILRHFPFAMRLIFRYALKQESFIADMQAYQQKRIPN